MKMDQKWIRTLVILVFYQNIAPGAAKELKLAEGQQNVEINCSPKQTGTINFWFRALDNSGMHFIAAFSPEGMNKVPSKSSSFSRTSMNKITLRSFKKAEDSGLYTCASLYKNELFFGQVTRVVGEALEITTKASPTTKANLSTTTAACVCEASKKNRELSLSMMCNPLILGPLAASCGLLLLLLITSILYCNRIRTRRCPHHYRRKRHQAPGKQMMVNRHV